MNECKTSDKITVTLISIVVNYDRTKRITIVKCNQVYFEVSDRRIYILLALVIIRYRNKYQTMGGRGGGIAVYTLMCCAAR